MVEDGCGRVDGGGGGVLVGFGIDYGFPEALLSFIYSFS
jgi:hypothetical protein